MPQLFFQGASFNFMAPQLVHYDFMNLWIKEWIWISLSSRWLYLCPLCSNFFSYLFLKFCVIMCFPWWLSDKESACQCRRPRFREEPLEKEMTTHFSILAWEIPWAEKPGGLQSMGLQRVGHDWAANNSLLFFSRTNINENVCMSVSCSHFEDDSWLWLTLSDPGRSSLFVPPECVWGQEKWIQFYSFLGFLVAFAQSLVFSFLVGIYLIP